MLKHVITKIPGTNLDIQFDEVQPHRWTTTIIHRLKKEKNKIEQIVSTNQIIRTMIELGFYLFLLYLTTKQ